MRRFVGFALVIAMVAFAATDALAQSESPSAAPSPTPPTTDGSADLCVYVTGQIPTDPFGWTTDYLLRAIEDGSLRIVTIGEQGGACGNPTTTATPTPTPTPTEPHHVPQPTPSPTLAAQSLTVNFTLKDKSGHPSITGQGKCHGTGAYADLTANTQITVSDANGRIVAVGSLGSVSFRMSPHECDWISTVENVPADLDIYQVEVGHRGALPYTRDELEQNAWIIVVTLGS